MPLHHPLHLLLLLLHHPLHLLLLSLHCVHYFCFFFWHVISIDFDCCSHKHRVDPVQETQQEERLASKQRNSSSDSCFNPETNGVYTGLSSYNTPKESPSSSDGSVKLV